MINLSVEISYYKRIKIVKRIDIEDNQIEVPYILNGRMKKKNYFIKKDKCL